MQKSFFNKIENIILKLTIGFLIIVFLIQITFRNEGVSTFFKIDSTINRVSSNQFVSTKKGILVLQLNDQNKYNKVEILVNGESVNNFNDNSEVTVYVYNNDIVEINGGMYNNKIKVKVKEISTFIKEPKLGKIIEVDGNIELIGKVQINTLE